MPQVIRVRDVEHRAVYDLGPDEPILRGPYELFNPHGPVVQHGGEIDYVQGGTLRTGRAVPSKLGDAHPGERVLVRIAPQTLDQDEWRLCDVVAVDGIEADE